MKNAKNGIFIRYLKSLYDKKLAALAEHSCISAKLCGEYPYISELFEGLLESDLYSLGCLCKLLCALGVDSALDTRIRRRACRGDSIDAIVAAVLEELRGEIDALERIHSLTDDASICDTVEKMRLEISENIKVFERILQS